jgi:hypothetical protein
MTVTDTPTYSVPMIARAIGRSETATGVLAARCNLSVPHSHDGYDEHRAIALTFAGALGAARATRAQVWMVPHLLDEFPEASWFIVQSEGFAVFADDGALPLSPQAVILSATNARTQLRCSALACTP